MEDKKFAHTCGCKNCFFLDIFTLFSVLYILQSYLRRLERKEVNYFLSLGNFSYADDKILQSCRVMQWQFLTISKQIKLND